MSLQSFESSLSSKDSSEDCTKNYEIVKKLGDGVLSEVYLATCKRGRLKCRSVVLKKIPATDDILGSVAVHQALCHPSILSLFSTFPTVEPDAEDDQEPQMRSGTPAAVMTRYIVLEHCGPHGTLSDHLPRLNPVQILPLEGSRIRGVVKTIADALTYLEKENVVHRRLIPESVHVTEDFRVKLGGFESAVRVCPGDYEGGACVSLAIEDPHEHHLAPEIRAGLPYDCSSDLWSLGLLILWMLDPSREPASNFDLNRIPRGDLGTLVSELLEKIPERRVKARSMYSHPFLDPTLPVRNLDPNPPSRPTERRDATKSSGLRRIREFESDRGNREVPAPVKPFGDLTSRQHPLRDLEGGGTSVGASRGYFLDVAMAAGPSTSRRLPPLRAAQLNRRVVSDPVHGTEERRKFLDPIKEAEDESASEEKPAPRGLRVRFRSKSATVVLPQFLEPPGDIPIAVGAGDSSDQVNEPSLESSLSILGSLAEGDVVNSMDEEMDLEESSRGSEEASNSPLPSLTLRQAAPSEPTHRTRKVIDSLVPESHSTPAAIKSKTVTRQIPSSQIHLSPPEPICHPFEDLPSTGTDMSPPKPFNTALLPPQTHRVTRGQLVVLPSRMLLVDFREGERRQGRRGIEVLTISPDGEEIRVFSAPRMSSPCCLVEPSATFKLSSLPKTYWKLYATAGKLIEQIKQHIPRLVLYESDSKFTMMANSPDADVEVVFYSSENGSKIRRNEGGMLDKTGSSFPRPIFMRIKVMQDRQLVEISRQVHAPVGVHDLVLKSNSNDLPLREKEGEWKKVVLVAPAGNIVSVDRTSLDGYERKGLDKTGTFLAVCRAVESGLDGGNTHCETSRDSRSPSSVLVCKTLPVDQQGNDSPRESESIGLARKLGHSLTPRTSIPSMGWNDDGNRFPFEPPSLTRQPGNFETRFIPSVGWCVRYSGQSGGAGRYRMMFFDGKTLEVDVDEECVELMDSVRDEVVRYKIRECSSKREVMEKMRAFKEFVSMFDDDGSELG